MTKAIQHVGSYLEKFKCDERIDDAMIKDLVKYHPTKTIDPTNLEWLKMKRRPPFNKAALFYKNKNDAQCDPGVEDDISWTLCIRNLYGRFDHDEQLIKDIHSAFRFESHLQTKTAYFIAKTNKNRNGRRVGECNYCKIVTPDISVDHYPVPYISILDSFVKDNRIALRDVEIIENEDNELKIRDEALASKWLMYHDAKAQYRLLCKSCNSHFGSYGYSSRTRSKKNLAKPNPNTLLL